MRHSGCETAFLKISNDREPKRRAWQFREAALGGKESLPEGRLLNRANDAGLEIFAPL
jgi:hypothetical protein